MDMGRKKIPLNLAIRADLSERLERYLSKPLAPTKTAFLEWALEKALDDVEEQNARKRKNN